MFSRLFNSLTASRKNSSKSTHHRPRLGVEQLEQRLVPALTPNSHLVIPHVEIHSVYYGQDWASSSGQTNMKQLDGFLQDVAGSSYMSMLGEYGVGKGTFAGHDVVSDKSSPYGFTWWKSFFGTNIQVSEKQITDMLSAQINNHNLPESNGTQLFIVYLPPNVTSQYDLNNSFFAHHQTFQMPYQHTLNFGFFHLNYSTTDSVYYAVVDNPVGNPTIAGLNQFQQQTEVTSHELAEAVTDPDLSSGWHDAKFKEIGDLANLQYGTFSTFSTRDFQSHSYTVQKEWSNYSGAGMMPTTDTSWLDANNNASWFLTSQWSFSWTDAGGKTLTKHMGIGKDGRWYSNWETSPGVYSGWFTYNT